MTLLHYYTLLLQQRYSQNPLALFRIIRHCLGTEMKLVSQIENLGGSILSMSCEKVNTMIGDTITEISQQLDMLRRRMFDNGEDLRKLEQEQEAFALVYHECTKINASLQQLTTQPQTQHSVDAEKKLRRYRRVPTLSGRLL